MHKAPIIEAITKYIAIAPGLSVLFKLRTIISAIAESVAETSASPIPHSRVLLEKPLPSSGQTKTTTPMNPTLMLAMRQTLRLSDKMITAKIAISMGESCAINIASARVR